MKNKINLFFTCFLVLGTSAIISQNIAVDSLLNVLQTTKEDTTNVNTLNALFLSYEFSNDVKAKEYLGQALELAKKIDFKRGLATTYTNCGYFAEDKSNYPEALKNYQASMTASQAIGDKKGIAFSYNNIGVINYYLGNYEEALKNHSTSLKIKESMLLPNGKLADPKGVANSHNNMGNVYFVQGNYREAIKNYAASLKVYKEMDNKIGLTASYNNIANVYSDQGNYPEALKNYFASLKIYEAMGNKKGEAITYNNIGAVCYNQGNYSEALKKYDEALKIRIALGDKTAMATTYNNIGNTYSDLGDYDKALQNYSISIKIREEIGDKAGLGDSYNNIGLIYYNQANKEKNPTIVKEKLTLAQKSYFSSLKMRETIGDKTGIANSCYNIGSLFIQQKKFKEAEAYLHNAMELSKEIGYKTNLKSSYLALSQMDSTKGDYKGAYENHKLFILYRDSLDNEETRKKTIQSQMTYDFEKKEAVATAEHKKELENQNTLAEEKSRKQKLF